jgi:trimeric autotransporter adhesin
MVIAAVAAAAALAAVADGASKHKRGTLDTVAGTGRRGFSGDGGRARRAKVKAPRSVAVDGAGNVYFAAPFNNRVRKVDTHGKITTIAGTGKKGFSGDGGPARNARLHTPYSVAVDSHGNVYIADMLNWRVRRVDAHGTITTFAGIGRPPLDSGGNGPAVQARVDATEVAVDRHDNVLVRGGDCTVRKVDANGTISTIAGAGGGCGHAGDGGLATNATIAPLGQLAADGEGNLYLADAFEARVRRVAADGTISTFAGTGKRGFSGDHGRATKAKLQNPMGVVADGKGNVFIADGRRVRKVNRKGIITTIAGTGKLTQLAHNGEPARKIDYWGPEQLTINRHGDLIAGDPTGSRVWVLYRIAAPVR